MSVLKITLGSPCGFAIVRIGYPNGEVAALLALAVSDPSFRPNAILEKSNQHTSSTLPAPRRSDARTPSAHVLSERRFLRHRFVWARKLCGQSLRDTPSGSTVGSTGWNGCGHEPWSLPDRQDASSAIRP